MALERTAEISDFIRARVATYASFPSSEIRLDQPFAEYGLDSISAVSLCADIEDHLKVQVEPTLAWDYPSINALATYLAGVVPAAGG
jgi:acyl carrier protein